MGGETHNRRGKGTGGRGGGGREEEILHLPPFRRGRLWAKGYPETFNIPGTFRPFRNRGRGGGGRERQTEVEDWGGRAHPGAKRGGTEEDEEEHIEGGGAGMNDGGEGASSSFTCCKGGGRCPGGC